MRPVCKLPTKHGKIMTSKRPVASISAWLARVNSQAKLTARQRLDELQTEAQGKFDDVQNRLGGLASTSANEQTDATRDGLCRCVEEFETLAKLYRRVPKVGREMRSALAKQKKEPSIRAVTLEPDAKRLWELAQKFEDEGQLCCAFQVYEEGAKQLPAPRSTSGRPARGDEGRHHTRGFGGGLPQLAMVSSDFQFGLESCQGEAERGPQIVRASRRSCTDRQQGAFRRPRRDRQPLVALGPHLLRCEVCPPSGRARRPREWEGEAGEAAVEFITV